MHTHTRAYTFTGIYTDIHIPAFCILFLSVSLYKLPLAGAASGSFNSNLRRETDGSSFAGGLATASRADVEERGALPPDAAAAEKKEGADIAAEGVCVRAAEGACERAGCGCKWEDRGIELYTAWNGCGLCWCPCWCCDMSTGIDAAFERYGGTPPHKQG